MTASIIKIKNLSLLLPVPRLHQHTASKGDAVGGRFFTNRQGRTFVKSLDGLNIDIHAGDSIGLVGNNGAGKSTLLRVMAGIYRTYKGDCEVRGGISTLFTNSMGLNNNGTGMENMLLMGRLLGLSNKQIEEVLPGMIDFCELGDYLHLPMRTYSAGMRTRIGFAIATATNPDVLLIDEVFGTGYVAFRKSRGAHQCHHR